MLNGLNWCEECVREEGDGVIEVPTEVEDAIKLLLDFSEVISD